MWSLSQGTSRRPDALADRRARIDGRTRRSSAATRTPRLIGAIIAGGANSRFGGEPKGLSVVGGVRIIDRVHRAMARVVDEMMIVANGPLAHGLRDSMGSTVGRIVSDARGERGSLVGLYTALAAASGEPAMIVAWDMPFVSEGLLRLLASRMAPTIDAVIPETPRGLQPFCAIYGPRCLPLVERALDAGEMRLSSFVDSLPVVRRVGAAELDALGDPERIFFNVNTPADLARAEVMAREE